MLPPSKVIMWHEPVTDLAAPQKSYLHTDSERLPFAKKIISDNHYGYINGSVIAYYLSNWAGLPKIQNAVVRHIRGPHLKRIVLITCRLRSTSCTSCRCRRDMDRCGRAPPVFTNILEVRNSWVISLRRSGVRIGSHSFKGVQPRSCLAVQHIVVKLFKVDGRQVTLEPL